jgi:hypothetical protein
MRLIIIVIILLTGCDDATDYTCTTDNPEPAKEVWIDTRCSAQIEDLVYDAVDEINRFGNRHMCRDLVEVVGYTETDFVPSVQCLPGVPEGAEDGRIAHSNEHTVSIYPRLFDGASAEWTRAVILHELTHWLGVHAHSPDRDANMNAQMIGIDHYTVADRDLICGQLDCIN